jgi:hypothetical protein
MTTDDDGTTTDIEDLLTEFREQLDTENANAARDLQAIGVAVQLIIGHERQLLLRRRCRDPQTGEHAELACTYLEGRHHALFEALGTAIVRVKERDGVAGPLRTVGQ